MRSAAAMTAGLSREAQQATAEYDTEQRAVQEKTARLRALRLARDAANQGGAARRSERRADLWRPLKSG
jgi:hypothetical protein